MLVISVVASVVREVELGISRRQSLRRLAGAAAIPSSALAAPVKQSTRIRLVVLDVGGTIVEDRGDVPRLLSSALAHHGIKSTAAEIGQRRGASKREIIRYFVEKQTLPPSANRDQLVGAIYEQFSSNLMEVYRSVPPIPGSERAIQQMRRDGYVLATSTGFDRAITMSIFRRLGWEKYFAAIICSDDVLQGRPAPYMLF